MTVAVCPCGGALGATPLVDERAFRIHECTRCGLLRTDPPPALGSFDRGYYEKNYLARLEYWQRRHREQHERHVLPLRRGGRLLDVGAGAGLYLSVLEPGAWQAEGIDPSPGASPVAREALGVNVRQAALEDGAVAGEFDVITMWDVLPPLPDPYATLRAARRLLRADGILIIKTPYAGRATRVAGRLLARAGRSRVLFQPEGRHNHFSARALRAALEACGFAVESMTPPKRTLAWRQLTYTGSASARLMRSALESAGATGTLVAVARPA